jgi:hypothetical protein
MQTVHDVDVRSCHSLERAYLVLAVLETTLLQGSEFASQ